MTAPSWKELIKTTRQLELKHGHEIARQYLMEENNKHGHKRCKGQIMLDRQNRIKMTRCNRFDCWRCVNRRVWQEIQRVVISTQFMKSIGDVYFVTITFDKPPDQAVHHQQEQFAESVNKLRKYWQRKAVSDGKILHYVIVHGIKPSNGEIHAHMVCNYLPDMKASPTPSKPLHVNSECLETYASEQNIKLWIERAESALAVGVYSGENLRETIGQNIIKSFWRVKASKYMPKVRKKRDLNRKTQAWIRDYGSGDVFAYFGKQEPIKIPVGLIDDLLKLGATIESSTVPDHTKTIEYLSTKSDRIPFYDFVSTKLCKWCGKSYPITARYFGYKKRGHGLAQTCIHCRDYDRIRDQEFDRKIDCRCKTHDGRVGYVNRLDRSEMKSRWSGGYTQCFYCDKRIHESDNWQIDHIKPLSDGGLNVNSNIAICCQKCHKLKTASGLRDGYQYLATIGKRKKWQGKIQLLLPFTRKNQVG